MLKVSKFNFQYKKDDEILVYNTFSKALVSLDEENVQLLNQEYIEDDKENEIISTLKENGILVDVDFDENEFLKYYNNKARFATDYFCLTIAPTLSCNFDCPYCFENKRQGVMSVEVQDRIIEFVKKKIEQGVKKIEITWYGGEPLLCIDIIKRMCEKIYSLAENANVKCTMGMITNGYLLNEDIVKFLEKYHISVQVTLDGLAENHNQRRYLINKAGTFDTIFNNLKLFNNRKINVYVRMNVDNFNYGDYILLDKKICEMNNPKMILYPAVTEPINERIESRNQNYMEDSIYNDFIANTRNQGVFRFGDSELPISNDVGVVPNDRCYFCAAELDNSCVIDEVGNVYKCWNEIGHNDFCFNLANPNDINYDSMLRYMGDNVFDDPKCCDCVFLPICYGGCKFHRYHLKRYACAFTEESIIKYIEDCLLK